MDTGARIVDKRKNWEARVEMAVLKLPKEELGTYEKLVYVILCGHANREGGVRLFIKTIADEASCSDRQVQRALSALEGCHLLARHAQVTPSGQTYNMYEVYGIEEYTPVTISHRGVTDSRGASDCQSGPYKCTEQPLKNKDLYSPTESAEAPPEEPKSHPVDISEISAAMRPTVKYFLHETGRESIDESELTQLRYLERDHYPTRINQEIDTAVARFRRLGRDPTTLTIDYLYESLRRQSSRKPKPRLSAEEKKRAEQERAENIALERERQEEFEAEVKAFFADKGGDGGGYEAHCGSD
jgi:hypothetical protein